MSPRHFIRHAATLVLALFVLTACGGDGSAEAAGGDGEAESRTTVATIFDESLEDDKCAIFTREDASAATGIPLEAIEKRYAHMCLYSWDAGDDYPDGNLNLMGLTVHDNVEQARGDYTRFSGDVTAEEIAAGKEEAQREMADRSELSEADRRVAGALIGSMAEMDFTHQHWTGIGDAANTDGRGTVRVLYGNVTVWITGKTDGEDWIHPAVGREVARLIVANLEEKS